jgi:hypothetical protein
MFVTGYWLLVVTALTKCFKIMHTFLTNQLGKTCGGSLYRYHYFSLFYYYQKTGVN